MTEFKKAGTLILACIMLLSVLVGCGNSNNSIADTQATTNESEQNVAKTEQTEYTSAVPAAYFETAEKRGQVVRVEYETQDYTNSTGKTITKPAYVYLPYGYDENDTQTKYNILYMMHGWTMTAEAFFEDSESDIVTMLDNMIAQGDIPPTIVVSATFDAENQSQDFSRSTDEIAVFHNDFRNDLVPYIEGRFHTYAEGTSEADLRSSREHRAFSGFSLGAVTTWYQFVYNLDYIKYFLPMSGDCWILGTYGGLNQPEETTEYLETVVQDGSWAQDDFYIYSGIGTADPIWDQVNTQMQAMFESDVFTPANLHYAIKENGRHDIDACEEYLFHALPIFFGNKQSEAVDETALVTAGTEEYRNFLLDNVTNFLLSPGCRLQPVSIGTVFMVQRPVKQVKMSRVCR